MDLDYAGDVSPLETWNNIKSSDEYHLVDCRTNAEWSLVGVPDLDSLGKKVLFIEWQTFPTMEKNPRFLQEISDTDLKKNSKIIFLCRSGARSRSAVEFLTSQGYENCFNCSEGFEGSHDNFGRRSNVNGWKFHNLPWKQG